MKIQDRMKRWIEYNQKLSKKMKVFDKKYMLKNKEHKCNGREDFDDGTWYCDHLINARVRKFRKEFEEERSLIPI